MRSFNRLALKTFRINNNRVIDSGSGRANKTIINSSRKSMRMLNIRAIEESTFLTPDGKKTFNHLQLAFIKAPIF